jgi:predicted MFS family arabinose efflux permease
MSSATGLSRDTLTWWAYGVLAAFAFLLNGFGPMLDDLRHELGISRTVAGLHSTGLAAGMLIAGALGERLRLRLGWLPLYWTACGGLMAGVLGLAAAGTAVLTVACVLVIGFAGTLLVIMVPSVLNHRHGDVSGAAIAEAHATAALVGVVAPLAVGASLAALGMWLPAFLAVTLGVLPVLGLMAPHLPAHEPVEQPGRAGAVPARLPIAYWRWWTALLFGVAAEFAVLLWAADDARERLELSVGAAALAPSAFLLGMGLARLFGARLVVGRLRGPVFRRAALLAAAAFVLYRSTDAVPVALLGLLLVGGGVGLLYPISLAGAMATAPGLEAQASTRSALASGIAIGSGPLAFGALADVSGTAMASWVVVALLIAGVATTVVSHRGGVADLAAVG